MSDRCIQRTAVITRPSLFLAAMVVLFATARFAAATTTDDTATRANPSLLQMQGAFEKVVKDVCPAVVRVEATKDRISGAESSQASAIPEAPHVLVSMSTGSGFIFDAKGLILTNLHVVDQARSIRVILCDRHRYAAHIVGIDHDLDLAVLRIDSKEQLNVAPLGDSSTAQVGDWVITLGSPLGLQRTVTAGIVSAKGRILDEGQNALSGPELIQTDAAINPGNSGGPLVNVYGEVIGISDAIMSFSGGSEGIGFGIPINEVKAVLRRLCQGKSAHAWLGVDVQDLTDDLRACWQVPKALEGVVVTAVENGGPASKAGLESGDLIVDFGGTNIDGVSRLRDRLGSIEPGVLVPVLIWRRGQQSVRTVVLGSEGGHTSRPQRVDRPKFPLIYWRGASILCVPPEIVAFLRDDETGAIVVRTEPGSPADGAGVEPGDTIVAVDARPVGSPHDLNMALQDAAKRKNVIFLLRRDNHSRFVVVGQH